MKKKLLQIYTLEVFISKKQTQTVLPSEQN